MDVFWQLAEENVATRQKAIVDLIDQIQEKQVVIPTLSAPKTDDEPVPTSVPMTLEAIIDYVLGRLVRGLGSSRQAARQGFSAALTQLLLTFPQIETEKVVELVNARAASVAALSLQEKRDFAIGQVFFTLVIARSNRIGDLSLKNYRTLINSIVSLQTSNKRVEEICSEAMHTIVEASSQEQFVGAVVPTVASSFPALASELTPGQLSVAIALRRGIDRFGAQSALPAYIAKITSPELFSSLIAPLGATVPLFPGIHTVWNHLIEDLASRSDISLSGSSSNSVSNSALVLFWRTVVQHIFITSPAPNRKGLALNLLHMALEILWRNVKADSEDLSADEVSRRHTWFAVQISSLFIKDMTRIFIFQLKTKGSVAHASAVQLRELLQQIAARSSTLAMAVMSMLTNPDNGGHRLFDQRSSSRLIHNIMTSLDSEGAQKYLDHVVDTFVNAEEIARSDIKSAAENAITVAREEAMSDSSEAATEDASKNSKKRKAPETAIPASADEMLSSEQGKVALANAVESIRTWALDQMLDLCKNSRKVPGTSEATHSERVTTVMNFILRHAYFTPKGESAVAVSPEPVIKKSKKSSSKATSTVDKFVTANTVVEVSEKVRKVCIIRLITILTDLLAQASSLKSQNAITGKDTEKDDGTEIEADGGMTPYIWAEKLFKYYQTLLTKGYTLVVEFNEGSLLAQSTASMALTNLMGLIQNNTPTEASPLASNDARRTLLPKLRAMYLFMLHLAVLQPSDAEDISPLLVDLDQIAQRAFPTTNKNKKNKIAIDEDADEWIEVLVDLLLSLLIKPSLLLRSLSLRVFGAFSDDITPGALSDLLRVIISSKNGDDEQEEEEVEEDAEEEEQDDEDKAGLAGLDAKARAKAARIIAAAVKSGIVSVEDSKRWDPLSGALPEEEEEEEEQEEVDFGAALRGEAGTTISGERLGERIGEDHEEIDIDAMAELLGQDAFMSENGEQSPQDRALEQLVRMKRARNQEQKDLRREAMNFKLRVLDLLEVIIKRQNNGALVLPMYASLTEAIRTCNTAELRPLHDRIFGLFKNRLCRSFTATALPSMPGNTSLPSAESILTVLTQRFEDAQKPQNHEMLALDVMAITRLANQYISAPVSQEQWDSLTVRAEPVSKKSSSKKSSSKTATSIVPPEVTLTKVKQARAAEVNAMFNTALDIYFTNKRSGLNTRFFTDIIAKSTPVAWSSLKKIAEFITTAPSTFLRTEAAEFTSKLMRLRNHAPSSETVKAELSALKMIIEEAQTKALQDLVQDEKDTEQKVKTKKGEKSLGVKQGSEKSQKALQKSLKNLVNVYSTIMKKMEEAK